MKNILIINIIISSLCSSCSAQEKAFVIKHTGMTNAYIYPIVFYSDSTVSQGFSDKYLKTSKYIPIKTKYISKVKVSKNELILLKEYFLIKIVEVNDTTIFSRQKGSFDFIWIDQNKVKQKISINNRAKSVELLNNLLVELDMKLTCYDSVFNEISRLIRYFEPNQTKEIITK